MQNLIVFKGKVDKIHHKISKKYNKRFVIFFIDNKKLLCEKEVFDTIEDFDVLECYEFECIPSPEENVFSVKKINKASS